MFLFAFLPHFCNVSIRNCPLDIGYSVIELNKTVIEISFAAVLPSSYQDILPTGTEILSPGILSYLYWDFVLRDFVPWDFVCWDSVLQPGDLGGL